MRRSMHAFLSVLLILTLLLSLGIPSFAQSAEPASEEPGDAQFCGGTISAPQTIPTLSAPASSADCEIFVASYGSDGAAGTRSDPLASLARAAEVASGAAADTVYVVLLTDLTSFRTARFYNKNVILLSDDAVCRVVRATEFQPIWDSARGQYNPALIECGRVEGTGNGPAKLTLENIAIDDCGAHGGRDFVEPVSGQDNSSRVQDGILAAYNAGASITLSDGASLFNYGGLSAVYLDGGAGLVMEDGSAILDTRELPLPEGGAAILQRGGSTVERSASAVIAERTTLAQPLSGGAADMPPAAEPTPEGNEPAEERENAGAAVGEESKTAQDGEASGTDMPAPEPEEEAVPQPGEASGTDLPAPDAGEAEGAPEPEEEAGLDVVEEEAELGGVVRGDAGSLELPDLSSVATLEFASDPENLSRLEDGILRYELAYDLSFTISDSLKAAMQAVPSGVTADGSITIQLDNRLELTLEENPTLDSRVFAKNGDVQLQNHVITVPVCLADNWSQYVSAENSAVLHLATTLRAGNFTEGERLSATAAVNLTVHTGSRDIPVNPAAQTVETKMLGFKTVTLFYNANGGDGAPATELVSPQEDCKLDSSTIPTHSADSIGPIVFIGWSENQDQHIYLEGEQPPETVTTVDIPEPSLLQPFGYKIVYAVWGYDRNGDGVADVQQVFLTLRYDANGGEGAPEPETKLATTLADGARFDISSTEPTRAHFSFQGWAEEPNATEAKYKYDARHAADRDLLIHEDTTLYAVWKENPYYTLYFNANGGSGAPAAQGGYADDVDGSGNPVLKLRISSQTPTRSGYSFVGWSVSRSGSASYLPNDEVQIAGGNVMLYAIWQRSGSTGSSYSGGSGASYSGGGSGGHSSTSPKTGDANNPLVYVILIAASLAAIGVTVYLILRNRGGKRRKAKRASRH